MYEEGGETKVTPHYIEENPDQGIIDSVGKMFYDLGNTIISTGDSILTVGAHENWGWDHRGWLDNYMRPDPHRETPFFNYYNKSKNDTSLHQLLNLSQGTEIFGKIELNNKEGNWDDDHLKPIDNAEGIMHITKTGDTYMPVLNKILPTSFASVTGPFGLLLGSSWGGDGWESWR